MCEPFLHDPFSYLQSGAAHTHTHTHTLAPEMVLSLTVAGIDLAEGLSNPKLECQQIKKRKGLKEQGAHMSLPGMFSQDQAREGTSKV